MIIDVHAHACGNYLDADNIIAALDKNNIDRVILCPGEKDSKRSYNFPNVKKDHVYFINNVISFVTRLTGVSNHIEELNQFVYTICQKNPDRILQGYWVDPNNNKMIPLMDQDINKFKFKLLKIHQCWSYFKFNSNMFKELTNWALKNNMPIFIHLKSKKDALDLIECIRDRQDNVFIIAHLIGIEEFIKNKNLLKNVYFDISCPQLIPLRKLNIALENFGSERLLFGSDIPYGTNSVELNIERINNLHVTQFEKDNILGNNIKKILNI